MGDLEVLLLTGAALLGIIVSSYLGYRQAKKADASVTFDVEAFVSSLLRAIPGIIIASGLGAFANLDFASMSLIGIIFVLFAGFNAGTASDVVLKRSWYAVTTKAASGSAVAQSAVAAVAKVQAKARLMFLWRVK